MTGQDRRETAPAPTGLGARGHTAEDLDAAERLLREWARVDRIVMGSSGPTTAAACVLAEYDRRGTELAARKRAAEYRLQFVDFRDREINELQEAAVEAIANRDSNINRLLGQVAAVRALADELAKLAAVKGEPDDESDFGKGFGEGLMTAVVRIRAALGGSTVSPREPIEKLIERSSLGTPEAKAARARVSDERAAEILARVKQLDDEQHRYLSTACLHARHDYCQATQAEDAEGELFARRPSQCKFCAAPCVCPCHVTSPSDTKSDERRPDDAVSPREDETPEPAGTFVVRVGPGPCSTCEHISFWHAPDCGMSGCECEAFVPSPDRLIGTSADPEFRAHQDHKHPVEGCGYCPTEDSDG